MIRVGEVLQLVSRIGKICTLHLPALLEASTQRRVIPPTVQIQTTTSPQQNSAVKSSDGCNGGAPGHPQTFMSLILLLSFLQTQLMQISNMSAFNAANYVFPYSNVS